MQGHFKFYSIREKTLSGLVIMPEGVNTQNRLKILG